MARPITKLELIEASEQNYKVLFELINSFTIKEQEDNWLFIDRDKNIRDVLAHLYEWQVMFDIWYNEGVKKGLMPNVPHKNYTWRTLPLLNIEIWKKYQATSLEDIKTKLNESHQRFVEILKSHTEEELFQKNHYKWTKSSNLAAYFIGNLASHYVWATNKIKKYKRELKIK